MNRYNFNDLESLYNFVKENPNKNLEDWLVFNSETLSEVEIEKYKNIYYYEFELNKVTYHLFYSNSNILEEYLTKFTGNKPYIFFQPVFTNKIALCSAVICFEDIEYDDFITYKDIEGLLYRGNDKLFLIVDDFEPNYTKGNEYELDSKAKRIGRILDDIKKEYITFYNGELMLSLINYKDNKYKKVIDLYKK